MGVNTAALKEKMAKHNLSNGDIAERLGIDASTFYRKMQSDGENFTVGQMHKIVEVLQLTCEEACNIFLWNNSQKCEMMEA